MSFTGFGFREPKEERTVHGILHTCKKCGHYKFHPLALKHPSVVCEGCQEPQGEIFRLQECSQIL